MAVLDLQALEPPVLEGHRRKRSSRWSKHCGGGGGGGGGSFLSLLLC
jgi:hypothetical protein